MSVDTDRIASLIEALLREIGEDPDRSGLKDTPARVSRFWRDFVEYKAGNTNTAFETVTTDQMVIVSGLRVWSLCEHHLLPFWADITIGYIAEKKILGLSKFARIAHRHAHKLQVQERLVHDIADEIQAITGSDNVAVIGRGMHTCMIMRGIRTDGLMTTSIMRGAFRESHEARLELINLTS